MKRVLKLLICLMFVLVLLAGCSNSISDTTKINDVLDTYEKAYLNEDISMLSNILADNITVISKTNGEIEENTMTKQQYLSLLSIAFALIDIEEFNMTNRNISVSGSQATVSADYYVKSIGNGSTTENNGTFSFKLHKVDDQWLISETNNQ